MLYLYVGTETGRREWVREHPEVSGSSVLLASRDGVLRGRNSTVTLIVQGDVTVFTPIEEDNLRRWKVLNALYS